jgi:hypothetical protein
MAVPTVTSVAPSSGPLAGANTVVLTGTGFTGTTGVSVGGTAATSFFVTSDTKLSVVLPAEAAGQIDIIVTNADGAATAAAGDKYTYVALPTVTAISPSSGGKDGGTEVTLTGTGFAGATGVKFGSANAASFTVNSATSITAASPEVGSIGSAHITVIGVGGTSSTSSADSFTWTNTYTPPQGDSEFDQFFMDV